MAIKAAQLPGWHTHANNKADACHASDAEAARLTNLSDCPVCHDVGAIARHDPEAGERIYCERCSKGIRYALAQIEQSMQIDAAWIARADARMRAGKPINGDTYQAADAEFEAECAEHDRLSALLAGVRHEEIGREPESLFFPELT